MALYTTIEVGTLRKGHKDCDTYHFADLEGAKAFAKHQVESGMAEWYYIEAVDWKPIRNDNPYGQLYGALTYTTTYDEDYNEEGERI